ncbi:AbrB/MazE/SpoVT family DNA-binding domain-containing protein [Paenibacillus alkalitolerans]|uniref:AbrB/MazE/SpoVT family DNA-binding domain-containing protein n=1 Tax=Paenibacillus alkalitolerans TaxID=2799335 RepID=UPI003898E8DC
MLNCLVSVINNEQFELVIFIERWSGISRKLDELGRIILPKELCEAFGVNDGDSVEFFLDGFLSGLPLITSTSGYFCCKRWLAVFFAGTP